MNVGVYLPPQALAGEKCPVLYWLSGLTCTEQNFITKAGAQQWAAQHGLIVVAPDTSPRGAGVPDDAAYDLGQGAGFYVNATQAPWAAHFRMEDYVAQELPALVERHFAALPVRGISGHSMGGHGAITLALRHPGRYRSVSAFAPICAAAQAPLSERLPLLVDQGEADEFLPQLRPDLLQAACERAGHPLTLRMHAGHDHSYYFMASFMADHMAHHAAALRAP